MFNQTLLLGNLTLDAEFSDGPRTVLRLATHRWWYQDDERKEATDFHRIVIFGPGAERAAKLRKGQRIFVEGRSQTRSWEDGEEMRYITEVVARRVDELSPAKDD